MRGYKRTIRSLIVYPLAKRVRKELLSEVCILVQKAQEENINNSCACTIIEDKRLVYPWITTYMVYIRIRQLQVKINTAILAV